MTKAPRQTKPKLDINVAAPPPLLAPEAEPARGPDPLPMATAAPAPSPLAAAKSADRAVIVRKTHAELLAKFPPPWVVGPYGDVWVAADVEQFDPEKETSSEKIAGPDGTFWRTNPERLKVGKPRHVFEPTDAGIAAFTVDAVNALLA